ncbi:MAG: DUF6356 family protein [Pseudomonadota bacterium]
MSLMKPFTEHPASVGETYFEHLLTAFSFSFLMLKGALCCAVHALFPFLFTKTGSECIECLHDRMVTHRSRIPTEGSATSETV